MLASAFKSRARWALVLACLVVATLSGCDAWRKQNVRGVPVDAERVLADPVARDPSFSRPSELNSFFRPGRDQGTWSDEAREIEHSLGVTR